MLIGRQDNARVMAMRSVSQDYQTRVNVLPLVVESLEKLSSDRSFDRAAERGLPNLPDGVVMMIDFIATVDREDATESLIKLLDSRRPEWVMAAATALGKNQRHAAIDKLATLVDSPHFNDSYGFRFTLARSLKKMEHPSGWETLATLYDRVDGQLAHRSREEFQTVTLEDFNADEERFRRWQRSVGIATPATEKASPEDSQPKESDEEMKLPQKMNLDPSPTAAAYLRERHLTPSKYYGIDIHARRLLFVIDRSGSMNNVVRYHTRLQRAKRELITAIEGLDSRCEFSILVFDTDIRAWSEKLVAADSENKKDAIRYVQRLSAGRSTNTYGALRTSIDFDDQLEAVFILTDGEPTTGMITNPTTILNDILRRNETRHITINAIAIAVDPLIKGFLRKLTEPSNGEFKDVP